MTLICCCWSIFLLEIILKAIHKPRSSQWCSTFNTSLPQCKFHQNSVQHKISGHVSIVVANDDDDFIVL